MFMPNSTATVSRPGNTRVTGKEQFYTPAALARELFTDVAGVVANLAERVIIEPAGGTGAFIKAAKKFGVAGIVSFDIEPKHAGISAEDFLLADIEVKKAVTISNPPFGRNNSLSIPFFNKAAEHSDYICFIVPRSWRKWSVINRLDQRFHLVFDKDIQIDYVDDNGDELSSKSRLATCFQIWQKRRVTRPIVSVVDNEFIKKVKPIDADVSLTIFGFNCGRVRTEFKREPNSTQMFLKLQHPRALEALQSVDFSRFFKNTAYTEALSLQEINFLLNEYLIGEGQLKESK
jgi:predicted RNA methylase